MSKDATSQMPQVHRSRANIGRLSSDYRLPATQPTPVEPSTDELPPSRSPMSIRVVRRTLFVAAACGALTLTSAGAASAVTVTVPGTPVTQPCSASADVTTNSKETPPVGFTSSTSCDV